MSTQRHLLSLLVLLRQFMLLYLYVLSFFTRLPVWYSSAGAYAALLPLLPTGAIRNSFIA
ncbi:hypothetical protein HOY82DRAFT_548162 [Tuber indicum]|nr:hypothetical protein HOY82DRAFT_548162 [Tuber indicum]